MALSSKLMEGTTTMTSKSKCGSNRRSSSSSSHSLDVEVLEEVPLLWAVLSYISYFFLVVTGYTRELLFGIGPLHSEAGRELRRDGYTPLYSSFEGFYMRNIFRRYKPVVSMPIVSAPSGMTSLKQRVSNDHWWTSSISNNVYNTVNLSSYNYLGYAENEGPCNEAAIKAVQEIGLNTCSTRHEVGSLQMHTELESVVSSFLGTESSLVVGMGFATNTLNMPRLFSKGTLILSDELNHASLILGMRLSGATIMIFKHQNIQHLEKLLRQAILKGHPRTRRPWKKIFIIVEGVYSMEGTIVHLPEIVALKKKYRAYIYLDEAHSVGAMGPNGRGVVDYFNLNPKDIDIMMGTFTKSFGSAGGYVAGSKRLIDYLRVNSQSHCYAQSMSPPVAMQVIAAMNQILNRESSGLERLRKLANNSRYFRQRLKQMGLIVYGNDDSPVIPILLILPAKIRAFVEEMLYKHGVTVVSVGFPAVPMTKERARFCMTSAHDKDTLDRVLNAMEQVADKLNLRYSRIKRDSSKAVVYGS